MSYREIAVPVTNPTHFIVTDGTTPAATVGYSSLTDIQSAMGIGAGSTIVNVGDDVSLLNNDAGYLVSGDLGTAAFTASTDYATAAQGVKADNAAVVEYFTVTVNSGDWSGSNPVTATVTVTGLLGTDQPMVDMDLSSVAFVDIDGYQDDWSNVYRVEASNNELTIYSTVLINRDVDLIIQVIR